MDSRFHGNDKPRRMSFPRKWESKEGYLAYYPINYSMFIINKLTTYRSYGASLFFRVIIYKHIVPNGTN